MDRDDTNQHPLDKARKPDSPHVRQSRVLPADFDGPLREHVESSRTVREYSYDSPDSGEGYGDDSRHQSDPSSNDPNSEGIASLDGDGAAIDPEGFGDAWLADEADGGDALIDPNAFADDLLETGVGLDIEAVRDDEQLGELGGELLEGAAPDADSGIGAEGLVMAAGSSGGDEDHVVVITITRGVASARPA